MSLRIERLERVVNARADNYLYLGPDRRKNGQGIQDGDAFHWEGPNGPHNGIVASVDMNAGTMVTLEQNINGEQWVHQLTRTPRDFASQHSLTFYRLIGTASSQPPRITLGDYTSTGSSGLRVTPSSGDCASGSIKMAYRYQVYFQNTGSSWDGTFSVQCKPSPDGSWSVYVVKDHSTSLNFRG